MNIIVLRTIIIIGITVALLTGCETSPSQTRVSHSYAKPATPQVSISKNTYEAVDALMQRSRQPLDKNKAILVATIVDIDNLNQSSTFGRLVAEQSSSKLVQLGYFVGEPKLRGTLAIKEHSGEMILSRDLAHLTKKYNAQAVLSGTYALGEYKVHVNLKLIMASNGRILSSVDYSLPTGQQSRSGQDIRSLFKK